jgi:hypothetical protein|tara:strand:- start:10717 stop:10878 length:162 start_codon:yes stop_codon:yes gene_type:complete
MKATVRCGGRLLAKAKPRRVKQCITVVQIDSEYLHQHIAPLDFYWLEEIKDEF